MLFYILFILLTPARSFIKVEESKISKICHVDEVDFWNFYYYMFYNSKHLQISIFEIDNNSKVIQEFISQVLIRLSEHKLYRKSFTITKYNLETFETINDDPECRVEKNFYQNKDDFEEERFIKMQRIKWYTKQKCYEENFYKSNCSFDRLDGTNATLKEVLDYVQETKAERETQLQKRIRSFSADLNYRYIIFVNEENDFYKHLENNWSNVFPNPRGIYVIAFISTKRLSEEAIEGLFNRIWTTFGVLNLEVQQPCTCEWRLLYTHDPFYPVSKHLWGKVLKYKIQDAINDPSQYRRSLQKLNWYPLKVSLFPRVPTAIKIFSKSLSENPIYKNLSLSFGYVGLDGMVLKTLCELLKITPIAASMETDYGYEYKGKYFGGLGEVVNRTIDASFNSRFVQGFGLDVIEYLTPVLNDRFCIIVPKALERPHYLMLFHCFKWSSWLLIGFTYLASAVYWFFVTPVDPRKRYTIYSFFEVFCLFLSVPITLWVTLDNHRIFFTSCMIFNIIIIGTFQGSLVTSFSTSSHYPDIDTLEDFDKSGLYIATATHSVKTVFGDDGSELFRRLSKKFEVNPKLAGAGSTLNIIATKRNFAALERRQDALLKIKMNYTDVYKVEMVHVVKECPRSYHYSYIVPQGSPYLHVFNIIITVLREAGLLIKWNQDVVDALIADARRNAEVNSEKFKSFTLSDMKIAFYAAITGNLIAILVFTVENIVARIRLKCIKEK